MEETIEFGCFYCWDKRKEVEKELYFFDHANNLRLCGYCPMCGRKYGELPSETNESEEE